MKTTLTQPETIRQLIVRLTKEAWDTRSEGVFLARLGSEVAKKSEAAAIELAGRSLSAFIKAELANDVKIIASPDDPLTQVAFVASAPVAPEILSQHISHSDPIRKAAHATKVTGAILHAFSRSIPQGCKRVIRLEPTVRFDDVGVGAPSPEGAFILDPKWIVSDPLLDPQNRSLQLMANIAAWRESVALDPKAIAKPTAADKAGTGRSVLEELLSSLNETDQKRLQLPLDIVAKLHNRIIK